MAGSLQHSHSFCQASVHLQQFISVLVFSIQGCRCKWMFRAGPEASLLEGLLKNSNEVDALLTHEFSPTPAELGNKGLVASNPS